MDRPMGQTSACKTIYDRADVGGYLTVVTQDVTTTGEWCFLAMHPELPGCMASGFTEAEAEENLADARKLYIAELKKRGIPFPDPSAYTPTLGTAGVLAGQSLRTTLPTAELVEA